MGVAEGAADAGARFGRVKGADEEVGDAEVEGVELLFGRDGGGEKEDGGGEGIGIGLEGGAEGEAVGRSFEGDDDEVGLELMRELKAGVGVEGGVEGERFAGEVGAQEGVGVVTGVDEQRGLGHDDLTSDGTTRRAGAASARCGPQELHRLNGGGG